MLEKLTGFLSGLMGRASLNNPKYSLHDKEAWEDLFGFTESESGITITKEKAAGVSAVWQAVHLIAGDFAKLPLTVFRKEENGDRNEDSLHMAYGFLHPFYGQANEEMPAFDLWFNFAVHFLLWGNGYIWIDRDNGGDIQGLYNLLPDRTYPKRHGGQLYIITEIDGKVVAFPHHDILHVKSMSFDCGQGADMVATAKDYMGLAMSQRGFTSKFFKNGLHAGGILQAPPGASDPATKKIEEAIKKRSASEKAFKTLVLRDGYKWHQTMVSPEDAQSVELDESTVRHIARFFNLSPDRLGVAGTEAYNNLESRKQDYYDSTLSHWLANTKAQANSKLLTEDQRRRRTHLIDYNTNALMWTDAKTRWAIYEIGIRNEVLSANEVRQRENMNRRLDGGGDTYENPNTKSPAPSAGGDDGDDDDSRQDAIRKASLLCLTDARRRAVNRLGIQAGRAAKKPDTFVKWLESFQDEHREACVGILSPAVGACRACGVDLPDNPAGELLGRFSGGLEVLLDTPRNEFAAAVDTYCKSFLETYDDE